MKFKKTALMLTIFCSLFLFTGCGSANRVVNYEDTNQDITTITFFGNKYEPENVTVIEEILTAFMKENPDIRISYESLKGDEYYEALRKRINSGKGDDVFMVNHDILLELQEGGQVVDLSQLSTIADYTDRMLSQMSDNGKIYWVPTTVSIFGLYCNLDLLKAHGQKVPANLQEWEDSCSYFRGKGITPVISNNDISLKTLAIGLGFYDTYAQNRQEEVFNRLNSGEEKLGSYLDPGFRVVKNFIDQGYVDAQKTLVTKKTSDDLQEFVRGEAPYMLTGAWAAGRVKGMEPDFSFEVAPLPALADGSLLVINADTRLSVYAGSENPDAAMKFVEYFTQAENIQKFADQQSSFSPLKQGVPSNLKEIRPLISCYESGRTVVGTDARLELPIWELTAEASRQLLSGESVDSVVQWIDRQPR